MEIQQLIYLLIIDWPRKLKIKELIQQLKIIKIFVQLIKILLINIQFYIENFQNLNLLINLKVKNKKKKIQKMQRLKKIILSFHQEDLIPKLLLI